MASNKTTREIPRELIEIKINQKLKKDTVDKNGKLLIINKSQVNRILREKFGKRLKLRKVFNLKKKKKKKDKHFVKK